MERGVLLVLSEPVSGAAEADYNQWYDEVHLPEVLALAGFVSARRFRMSERQLTSQGEFEAVSAKFPHRYLALYEVEAENLGVAVASLNENGANLNRSDAMSYGTTIAVLYEEITRR